MAQYDVQRKALDQKSSSNSSTRTVQLRHNNVESIIQMAKMNPQMLTQNDVMVLQKTMGNGAVNQLFKGTGDIQNEIIQKKEEELIDNDSFQVQKENNTGLPDNLKAGVENLSGLSMDDVRVHYNSDKPMQVGALAYTQGTDIHVAPGQEKHLAHEAWHVVQQAQGRVQATTQMKGVAVNDDIGLEKEADVMGNRSLDINRNIGINDNLTYIKSLRGKSNNHYGEKIQKKKLKVTEGNVAQFLNGAQKFKLNEDEELKKRALAAFGDKLYSTIISCAENLEQLIEWIGEAERLKAKKAKAGYPVVGSDAKEVEKDEKEYDKYLDRISKNKEHQTEWVAAASTSTPGAAAASWAAVASGAAAAASPAKKETGPPQYKDLKLKSIKVKENITKHGEIDGINLKNIIKKIEGFIDAVYFVEEKDEKYKYKLDLDDKNCIIIEVSKSMEAIITHFGPFGVSTSGDLEKKSSSSSSHN